MSYGTLTDLTSLGLPANALANVPSIVQQASLDALSSTMDSYIGDSYSLPLLSWPISLNRCNAVLSAYDLLVVRGYNPAAGGDTNFRDRYRDQIRWLEGIAKKTVQLIGVVQSPSATNYSAPQVISSSVVSVATGYSRPNRGW